MLPGREERRTRADRAREGFTEALEELTNLLRPGRGSQARVGEDREPLVENNSRSSEESENRYAEMGRRSRSFSPPRASESSANRWAELSRMCLTPPPVGTDSDTLLNREGNTRFSMSSGVRRTPRTDLLQPNDRPEFFLPPFNSTERSEGGQPMGSLPGTSVTGSRGYPSVNAHERWGVRGRNVHFEENDSRNPNSEGASGVISPTPGEISRLGSAEEMLRAMTLEQIGQLLEMRGDLDNFHRTVIQPMRGVIEDNLEGSENSPQVAQRESGSERRDESLLSPSSENLRRTNLLTREVSLDQGLPCDFRDRGRVGFRSPLAGAGVRESSNEGHQEAPVWERRDTSPVPRDLPSAPILPAGMRNMGVPGFRVPPHRERIGDTPPPVPERNFERIRAEEIPLSPSRANFRVEVPSPSDLPEPAFGSPRRPNVPLTERLDQNYPARIRPIPVRGEEYERQRAEGLLQRGPPYNPDYVPMMPGGAFDEHLWGRRENVEPYYRPEMVENPWRSAGVNPRSHRDWSFGGREPSRRHENSEGTPRPIRNDFTRVESDIAEEEDVEIPSSVLRGMENVKPFDGTKRTAIALTMFLQELDSALTIYVPNRIKRAANYDNIKASLLRLRLKGEALNTFASLSDQDRNSYERAEKALKEIYEEQLPTSEIWEKLNNLTQGPLQSVWQLRQEVQYWVERHIADDPMAARMSEAELKSHANYLKVKMFFSALREDILTEVVKAKEGTTDFDVLVNKATDAEKVMRVIKSHKKSKTATGGPAMSGAHNNPQREAGNTPRPQNKRRDTGPGYVNQGNNRRFYVPMPPSEEVRRCYLPVPMGPPGDNYQQTRWGGAGPGQGPRGPNFAQMPWYSAGPNPQGLNPINMSAPRPSFRRGNFWRNNNNMAPVPPTRSTALYPRSVRPRGGVNANSRYVARSQPL